MGSHHDLWSKQLPASQEDEEFFREHHFSRSPLLVQWMATESCSLSCAHCLVSEPGPSPQLGFDEVTSLLDQVADLGVQQFLLTGGEPLEREDLADIIGLMQKRQIPWSLNTARAPDAACRRAMQAYPPSFVAVSLDGPERYHDRHRGQRGAHAQALESIAYFRGITPGDVVAGTTITRESVGLLEETLGVVMASGATQWGLHVVFPEGRAAERPGLYLGRRQLARLMTFAAEKGQHFPIGLGDEFGYLGSWEPLLRDGPFYCGAGRIQCVVLADGEVVPCTTTDRSTSAGSLRERALADLWATGFAELRNPQLDERCQRCGYSSACGGGCWLQRRHGVHCYREVWSRPRELATAAGLALCLGLGCAPAKTETTPDSPRRATPTREAAAERRATPTPLTTATPVRARPAARTRPAATRPRPALRRTSTSAAVAKVDPLEKVLLEHFRTQTPAFRRGRTIKQPKNIGRLIRVQLRGDPAGKYLLRALKGKPPRRLSRRVARIRAALKTKHQSLSFVAVLFRDLSEWCLDRTAPHKRSKADRKRLRETLTLLASRARQVRKAVLSHRVASVHSQRSSYGRCCMRCKAIICSPGGRMVNTITSKRWAVSPRARRHATKQLLQQQNYARSMRISFQVATRGVVKRLSAGKLTRLKKTGTLGVFDLLRVGRAGATLKLAMDKQQLSVKLPASSEITWADLLRLTYEQNRALLDRLAPRYYGADNRALTLPALRSLHSKASAQGSSKTQALAWRLLAQWLF